MLLKEKIHFPQGHVGLGLCCRKGGKWKSLAPCKALKSHAMSELICWCDSRRRRLISTIAPRRTWPPHSGGYNIQLIGCFNKWFWQQKIFCHYKTFSLQNSKKPYKKQQNKLNAECAISTHFWSQPFNWSQSSLASEMPTVGSVECRHFSLPYEKSNKIDV